MSNFSLLPDELQVVKKLCELGNDKAIARAMSIPLFRVKLHIKRIRHKLGFGDRVLLAVWAVRNGLDV